MIDEAIENEWQKYYTKKETTEQIVRRVLNEGRVYTEASARRFCDYYKTQYEEEFKSGEFLAKVAELINNIQVKGKK